MPYSSIKMNPAFTLCLIVVFAICVQEIEAAICGCMPACDSFVGSRSKFFKCCACACTCLAEAYKCNDRCAPTDWDCASDCTHDSYKCGAKCLNIGFEACCKEKGVNADLPCNYTALLQHPALDRSSSALSARQGNNHSSYDYLICMTRGEDHTECCREAGVSEGCLEMCKPLDEHHDISRCVPNSPIEIVEALARCSSEVQMPFGQ
ncbi:DB module domain-containing protein [Ditylenchus destructor]|nr:DB module domain-containing protein [Ditylenchus destructor]